jgi:hypothetical protein
VTYVLATANLLMIGLAYALSGFGSTVGILGLIAAASLLTAFLLYRRRVHKEQMERMYGGSPTIDMAKIMSFRKKRVRIPEDN